MINYDDEYISLDIITNSIQSQKGLMRPLMQLPPIDTN